MIVAAHHDGSEPKASEFLKLYTEMLGHFCREAVLQYLPRDGVYFAGSVARGVLSAGFESEFIDAFRQFEKFEDELSNVPFAIIEDECAALIGCVAAVRQDQAAR